MATTNKSIIDAYKAAHGLPLDLPLFTYAAWIAQGYRVRKGEKCRHRVTMWKHSTKKDEEGNVVDTGRCFHKVMNLFTIEQVEKIAAS